MLLDDQARNVNEAGHLVLGGCDCVELADTFGTPLYVLDEELLRGNCRAYVQAFSSRVEAVEICYAGKALLTTGLARLVQQEGLGLDVASAGELYTALKADFPPERIKLHGNFKSDLELEMALDAGVGRIVVDSLSEIDRLQAAAARLGKEADVLLRVTPGIRAHTHDYVATGHVDSKFGLGVASGAAEEGTRRILACENLRLRGFHCHIGSQVFALDGFARATEIMVGFAARMRDELDYTAEELDMGGGLGIAYTHEDAPPTIDEFAEVLCSALLKATDEQAFPVPKLILEPGRSIVGPAGITLYRVGPVKEIPGVRTYVAVDGGLSDNPRPALYDAQYEAVVANKADLPTTVSVRVAGKHCETDTLLPEISLQPVEEGDVLAVFCTGAYNYAMASNYNRFPRPAMVLVRDGRAEVLVERESLEDLVRQDRVPPGLQG
ncbi:MAG: diaminopimelate decarboxylase [Armatimonadetes bacterium]|nr:diaminopimelate decarboxylase [Armatimonadota bacterium]